MRKSTDLLYLFSNIHYENFLKSIIIHFHFFRILIRKPCTIKFNNYIWFYKTPKVSQVSVSINNWISLDKTQWIKHPHDTKYCSIILRTFSHPQIQMNKKSLFNWVIMLKIFNEIQPFCSLPSPPTPNFLLFSFIYE